MTSRRACPIGYTKWMCKYHIVFTPKYRRKIVYNQYLESIKDIIKQLCSYKGVEIIEGHLMPDHVHLLLSIPPKMSVSSFMGYLKGKSALMIFDRHGNLKYKFGNRHFWAEGYYVSTVGMNEATIKKYIQDQEWIILANFCKVPCAAKATLMPFSVNSVPWLETLTSLIAISFSNCLMSLLIFCGVVYILAAALMVDPVL